MWTVEEDVGPEQATQYLEHNRPDPATGKRNRPVTRQHVKDLASDMANNRWRKTHQGIAFSPDGRLLDGQHRLLAIVMSGVTIPLLVTRDVEPEAMDGIDQHQRRTAAQIASMQHGVDKEASRLAAMAGAILQVAGGDARPSSIAKAQFLAGHQQTLERYLPVARAYAPAVAAAFAYADMLGWDEVQSASQRLLEKLYTEGDPMRALDIRSRTFSREQGAKAGKKKFDITLNALLAVHEHRDLNVARSAQPDYRGLERRSKRPSVFADQLTVQP